MRKPSLSRNCLRHGPQLFAGLALLLAAERVQASWPPLAGPGLTVADAPASPNQPASAPDGHGGVFLAWTDFRTDVGQTRLYAQHVDGKGTPLWTEDGMVVNSSRVTDPPRVVFDGTDGAVLVWRDFRADTAGNVYAQHLSGAGEKLWNPGDVSVAAGPLHEVHLSASPDGAGGTLVAWSDDRTGISDIRIQRLTASGTLDWGPDGVAMLAPELSNNPLFPQVCADGAGGALVGFTGFVAGTFNALVQRVSPAGVPQWTSGGVRASTSTLGVNCAGLAADGTGGALVALRDNRSQNSWQQAFAQRIAADGSVAWAQDGLSLSGSAYPVEEQNVVGDGAGGGFFEWCSYLNDGSGASRLLVQHISTAGAALWGPATQVLAEAIDGGSGWLHSQIVSDDAGGVVIGWNAQGTSSGFDISAQRLSGNGSRLWSPGPRVLASVPNIAWQMGFVPDGSGGAVASWLNFFGSPGPLTLSAERVLGTGTLDVPTSHGALNGIQCAPLPARASEQITLRFALAQPGSAGVRVLDVSGRLVRSLPIEAAAAGDQALVWDGRDEQGLRVRPGLYLVRVDAPGSKASGRAVVVE